jgi:hypothetical protein
MICPENANIWLPSASGDIVKADNEKPPDERGPDATRHFRNNLYQSKTSDRETLRCCIAAFQNQTLLNLPHANGDKD